jgi:hypothetical protein
MSGRTIASAAAHFVLKCCAILMATDFGFGCCTCMAAPTVSPTVDRGVPGLKLTPTALSAALTAATLITMVGTVAGVTSVAGGVVPASGLILVTVLVGQLGLEESHGLLHLLELCLQLLLNFRRTSGQVCHLSNDVCCLVVCWWGFRNHSILNAINDLLYQVGIVAPKVRLFECDVCRLSEFLMSATEVCFEVNRSFLDFWSAIPVGDVESCSI